MSGLGTLKKPGAHWFVLLAAVLWGTTGTARSFAPDGASPATVGAVRLVIGGTALIAFSAAKGTLESVKRFPILITVMAAISTAAYQPLFFTGVAKTGVAVGTVVTIGSAPVFAGLLGLLIRGERLRRCWMAATALAILGCALLFLGGDNLNLNPSGIAMALGAGLAYGVYSLTLKTLLDKYPPEAVMAVVTFMGAVLLSPLLFTSNLKWLTQPAGLIVAIHLGLITSAVAYVLFSRGLARLSVATAVTLSLAEPLTAALLGVVVLDERLTLLGTFGISLLLIGLGLLSFKSEVVVRHENIKAKS